MLKKLINKKKNLNFFKTHIIWNKLKYLKKKFYKFKK